jgi:hypothetical protein
MIDKTEATTEETERDAAAEARLQQRRADVEGALSVVSTLTAKDRRFVAAFLMGDSLKDAYLRANPGYTGNNARKLGWQWRHKEKIQAAVDEYFHAQEMSAAEVVARLSDQARGSLGDFLDIGDGRDPALDLAKAEREGKMHLLKKFKQKRTTFVNKDDEETTTEWIEVELHDSQSALVHVGRFRSLFTDKTDLTSGGERIVPNIYMPDNGRDNGEADE